MKYQLILFDSPVIVSDEILDIHKYPEIVVEVLTTGEHQLFQIDTINDIDRINQKKIISGTRWLPTINLSLLSEEHCKKIGYVDINEMSERAFPKDIIETSKGCFDDMALADRQTWEDGFRAAIKTMYNEAHIRDAIKFGANGMNGYIFGEEGNDETQITKFIESLKYPRVVDIEIEMEEAIRLMSADIAEKEGWVKLPNTKNTFVRPKITNNQIKITKIL